MDKAETIREARRAQKFTGEQTLRMGLSLVELSLKIRGQNNANP